MFTLLQVLYRRRRFGAPIVVVSGLPRSGTSMMMRMLEAGGMVLFTDGKRISDEDNPKGYFELERVKQLTRDTDRSWLKQARGKAVKIISEFLPVLPPENYYQVLFMNRRLDEVIASQNKMLQRLGKESGSARIEEFSRHFEEHLKRVKAWLKVQQNIEVAELEYTKILSSPESEAARICSFLNRSLDVKEMAGAVELQLYRNRSLMVLNEPPP